MHSRPGKMLFYSIFLKGHEPRLKYMAVWSRHFFENFSAIILSFFHDVRPYSI